MKEPAEHAGRVRLDKWLWAARFYKTRGLSAEAIDAGKIEVNGERAKRARLVQAGDRVKIRIGPYEHVITIKGVSEKRGSAPIAQALYEEDAESKKAREVMAAHVRAMNANTGYESGRPTKKDRREIERLRRRD
ncbi:MAG TPA: RNA-binding S4 domain-containing protein [Gemmatimonadaceae bacterium]